jgi:ABC-type Na+ efflux pump permease subunit
MAIVATCNRLAQEDVDSLDAALRVVASDWAPTLQALYALFLVAYGISVAFRAAGCVVGERQMHALDMLLQLPIERSEILRAKRLGALLKGWPWVALLFIDLVVGLLIGAYHPFSFLFMLLMPLALILALCSVGLCLSTIVRTVGQANLAMAGTLLGLVVIAAGTRPGLFVGYSALTHTWWESHPLESSDSFVAGVTLLALVWIAASAHGLAGRQFARLGRR